MDTRRARLLGLLLVGLVLVGKAAGDEEHSSDNAAGDKDVGEKFEFQAEVTRLMDILIHSLYSEREIFIRELISNASDALDKIRFLGLTSPKLLEANEKLEIHVKVDKENKKIEITDSGVGMTRDDMIKNLGTIAKSGTSSFLEDVGSDSGKAKDLIGQFGVGFYSAYLVADTVLVRSKHNDDKQHVWKSAAQGSYSVYEDTEGPQLARGTSIELHLKEDADQFLGTEKMTELIKRYSQFIQFPIFIEVLETKEIEMTEEEIAEEDAENERRKQEEKDAAADDDDEEIDLDDEDKTASEDEIEGDSDDTSDNEDDDEEDKPRTKSIKVPKWEQINNQKPLWLRDPEEVTDEQHQEFYEAISSNPVPGKIRAKSHFRAEGELEFRSILYVPDSPPKSLNEAEGQEKSNIKLFIRRVLVKDSFEVGLLPKYLHFICGLVDSDDLQINVSRELLQNSKSLDTIRRKLVRKALEMIRNIMTTEVAETDEEDKDDDEEGEKETKVHPYIEFWKKFGVALKYGVVEDSQNRARLTKLLRYPTTKTDLEDENDLASLDQYVERMKDGQKSIYYLTGENKEQIKDSPFLEKLLEKDYEVVLMTDVMDDYLVGYLKDYEGHTFTNIAKESFKFSEDDQKEEKDKLEKLKTSFKPLTKFIKNSLKGKVAKVKLSNRLSTSPCAVSSDQYGQTARMETIMRAQAFSQNKEFLAPQEKILEINPYHPVIRKLGLLVAGNSDDEKADEISHIIFDTALISSGYYVSEPLQYQKRMQNVVAKALEVDPNEGNSDEPLFEEEEVDEEADDAKDEI